MATALYRRYRPESFADVIGQDHVTTPLRRALRNGRVGHAYLFSGPRGCGKTTSARILARCLNCAEGPTDTPCGQCDSCRDLSRGGAGSLDVVEIDAASHGGVDDARELRERATFAPARDRFKVFIIDEAHMVTSAGFNALLKLVEEPPEHVKFVFATTEPDKVIGTIRSRTHHYPFRLIPPQVLLPYLHEVCEAEGVGVGEGVLPLVVRAGGGSARDTMSVLDQLMAGAGEEGLDQQTATALLGFTDSALLDRAVVAVGERDGAALYGAVEQVLVTGHEPRRFVEDLLERVRDLIVLSAVPEGGAELLPHVPAEDLEQMRGQASTFQPADLSRCGDLIHETLTTMSGATSPRLHLELLAARLVLRDDRAATRGPAPAQGSAPAQGGTGSQGPGQAAVADRSPRPAQTRASAPDQAPAEHAGRDSARRIAQEQGDAARRARSESAAHGPTEQRGAREAAPTRSPAQPPATSPTSGSWDTTDAASRPTGTSADDSWGAVAVPGSGVRPAASAPSPSPADRHADAGADAGASDAAPAPAAAAASASAPATAQSATPAPTPGDQEPGPVDEQASRQTPGQAPGQASDVSVLDASVVRGHWPAILEELSQIRRPAWALISQNGHVHAVQGSTVVIGFRTDGLLSAFHRGTTTQNLGQAIQRVVGRSMQIDGVVGEDPGEGSAGSGPARGPDAGGGPGTSAGPGSSGESGTGRGPGGRTDPGKGSGARDDRGPRGDDGPRGTASWGSVVDQMGEPGLGPSGSGPTASSRPPSPRGQTEGGTSRRAPASRAMSDDRDLPPDPEDPYPPDLDEPNPFDEDEHSAPGPAASIAEDPGRLPTEDLRSASSPPQDGGAGHPSANPSPMPPAASSAAPRQDGEVPEVDDERRDDVPDGEPRTHGQAALRRAIAEDRTIRTRELPRAVPAQSSPAVDERESLQDRPDEPAPAAEASQEATGAASGPASPPNPPASTSHQAASSPHRPGSGAVAWDPEPDSSAPASASASAEELSRPAPAGDAASEARGAELARRAAQASRLAAQDRQAHRATSSGATAEQADPTGGASRDDADASVARRSGREVIETVLGGRVLEVIDETRG